MIEVSDSDLNFSEHLKLYQGYIRNCNPETDAKFFNKAYILHSLTINDALISAHFISVSEIARMLVNADAKYFMLQGAAQRLKLIWVSFRSLFELASPDRTEPLTTDEAAIVSRDLNVIYINIRATIDNFAWCLGHEKGTAPLKAYQVDLFSEKFMTAIASVGAYEELVQLKKWWIELKSKRDPAAHRIPLSVPSQVFTPEEQKSYQRGLEQAVNALKTLDFETSIQRFQESERLGTFIPFFCHKPDAERVLIYPTVPEDIGVLVKISRVIFDAIRKGADGAETEMK